jgi:hypothetical protein
MSDSNVVIRKKRGRPRIGQIPVVSFRLEPEWRQEIDEWRSGEPGHPCRSDAVRISVGESARKRSQTRFHLKRKETGKQKYRPSHGPRCLAETDKSKKIPCARESGLAGVHPETGFVEAGGLVSYGPSLPDLFLRAATARP